MGEGELCKHEFNAQMQAMQSRVDNLEKNAKSQMSVLVQTVISTWTALVAGGVTAQAAAKYLADPFIALLILGYVDRDAYDSIMGLLGAVPGAEYLNELFADLILEGIGLDPFDAGLINQINGKLSAVTALAHQQLIAAIQSGVVEDIENAIAAVAEAEQAEANAAGMFTALTNVSACKVASNVFQAAVL